MFDPEATSLMGLFFRLNAKTDHLHRIHVEPVADTFRVWCEVCSLAPFTIVPEDILDPGAGEIVATLRDGSFPEACETGHLRLMFRGYFERSQRRQANEVRQAQEARQAQIQTEREAFEASRPWGHRYDREVFLAWRGVGGAQWPDLLAFP
jgi:hypothetical protein